jgi:hypothetical protein
MLMHLLFLAAAHQVLAAIAQAYPTCTTSSAEIMGDLISGFVTLGLGTLIYRLPPEK